MKKSEIVSSPFDTDFNWSLQPHIVKDELSKASPSYCLVKWAHSTIHFQLGKTHSCHNLPTHEIPFDQIGKNPSALVLPPRTNPGPTVGFGKRKGPLWQESIMQWKKSSNIFEQSKTVSACLAKMPVENWADNLSGWIL